MTRTGSEQVQSGNLSKCKLQAECNLEYLSSREAKERWNKEVNSDLPFCSSVSHNIELVGHSFLLWLTLYHYDYYVIIIVKLCQKNPIFLLVRVH